MSRSSPSPETTLPRGGLSGAQTPKSGVDWTGIEAQYKEDAIRKWISRKMRSRQPADSPTTRLTVDELRKEREEKRRQREEQREKQEQRLLIVHKERKDEQQNNARERDRLELLRLQGIRDRRELNKSLHERALEHNFVESQAEALKLRALRERDRQWAERDRQREEDNLRLTRRLERGGVAERRHRLEKKKEEVARERHETAESLRRSQRQREEEIKEELLAMMRSKREEIHATRSGRESALMKLREDREASLQKRKKEVRQAFLNDSQPIIAARLEAEEQLHTQVVQRKQEREANLVFRRECTTLSPSLVDCK